LFNVQIDLATLLQRSDCGGAKKTKQ